MTATYVLVAVLTVVIREPCVRGVMMVVVMAQWGFNLSYGTVLDRLAQSLISVSINVTHNSAFTRT